MKLNVKNVHFFFHIADLSISVIEEIHREEANCCRAKESYWIQTLRTLTLECLNLDP